MLESGRYTIRFSYQPKWKEESWTREEFGRVESAAISLEVTDPAPEMVRRSGEPLNLELRPEAGKLVAELVSTWDRDQWISLNLGQDLSTHGRIEWRIRSVSGNDDEPVQVDSPYTEPIFQASRVHRLVPAGRLRIGEMPLETLHARVRAEMPGREDPLEVGVRYMQLATPDQIRERLGELGRAVPEIPAGLFSGTVSSQAVKMEVGNSGPPPLRGPSRTFAGGVGGAGHHGRACRFYPIAFSRAWP
jgi:hypothetical protein